MIVPDEIDNPEEYHIEVDGLEGTFWTVTSDHSFTNQIPDPPPHFIGHKKIYYMLEVPHLHYLELF